MAAISTIVAATSLAVAGATAYSAYEQGEQAKNRFKDQQRAQEDEQKRILQERQDQQKREADNKKQASIRAGSVAQASRTKRFGKDRTVLTNPIGNVAPPQTKQKTLLGA